MDDEETERRAFSGTFAKRHGHDHVTGRSRFRLKTKDLLYKTLKTDIYVVRFALITVFSFKKRNFYHFDRASYKTLEFLHQDGTFTSKGCKSHFSICLI
jgi:hypothetical protein